MHSTLCLVVDGDVQKKSAGNGLSSDADQREHGTQRPSSVTSSQVALIDDDQLQSVRHCSDLRLTV